MHRHTPRWFDSVVSAGFHILVNLPDIASGLHAVPPETLLAAGCLYAFRASVFELHIMPYRAFLVKMSTGFSGNVLLMCSLASRVT